MLKRVPLSAVFKAARLALSGDCPSAGCLHIRTHSHTDAKLIYILVLYFR